jgi:ketosteroid isomerase-like protein
MVREIADRLVALCRAGEFVRAIEELYAPDVAQSENGAPPIVGRGALVQACRGWLESRTLHNAEILSTHVGDASFVVEFRYDLTPHATKERLQWCEAAVYRVANGKISDVRFYYKPAAA